MKLEFFLISGWRLTLPKIVLVSAMDAHGKYYHLRYPGYNTYMRTW